MRLIDADAVMKKFKSCDWYVPDDEARATFTVDSASTVDAKPVVHAHWIDSPWRWTCSNCGGGESYWLAEEFKYCPYCGAKMDGGGAE